MRTLLIFLSLSFIPFTLNATIQENSYSQREAVQSTLDHCRNLVWKIDAGEIQQESGLCELDYNLRMLKFQLWFLISDDEVSQEND